MAQARGPRPAGRRRVNGGVTAGAGGSAYLPLAAFALLYLAATLLWRLPSWVALVYGAASLLCFAAYALDKAAAVRGRWRTPERTLLMLGLACGWPGAILAQQWLRHKSGKRTFRTLFWATVAANVATFTWLARWQAA